MPRTPTTEKRLSEHALNVIKDTIQTELLKRGFLAPITLDEETGNYPRVTVASENFQTVPVIFKSIKIFAFGGGFDIETKTRKKHRGEEKEEEIFKFWIPVHIGYDHFDGGSNSSELFRISGWVTNDKFDERVYELSIK